MIKQISGILLIGLIIAVCAMVVMREPGFAVFSYADTTLEIALINLYFGVVIGFILLYFTFRLIGKLIRIPAQLKAQRRQKTRHEIMQALEATIINACLQDWDNAVKTCTRHIKDSPIKRAQHILTAYCAHQAGHHGMRNTHLHNLRLLDESDKAALSLDAQYMLADGKPEKAIALLKNEPLADLNDLNTLTSAYLALVDTREVEQLLPKLYLRNKNSTLADSTINHCLFYLINLYQHNNIQAPLTELWKTYSLAILADNALLEKYITALYQAHQDILAEQIIVSVLQQNWNETLVQSFGQLNIDNVEQRIKQAQQWLAEHKNSAGLLLTLGRLHKQQKLWGQAKSYLEASLSRRPLVATYAELSEIHEQLNEIADARRCAKKALHLASENRL